MMLNFMVESIQGPCRGNQDQMIKSKILNFIKEFLQELDAPIINLREKGFFLHSAKQDGLNKEDEGILHNLFNLTVKLVLSLLESNFDRKVIKEVGKNISFHVLTEKLQSAYYLYLEKHLKLPPAQIFEAERNPRWLTSIIRTPLFPKVILESFDIFSLFQIINDMTGIYASKIELLSGKQKFAYNFYSFNCEHIELVFDDILQKVYFLKHPACNYLHQEDKEMLMSSVSRDNPAQKLSDFLWQSYFYFDLMNHFFHLSKNAKIKLTSEYLEFVRNLALVISCILNIFIITTFSKGIRSQVSFLDISHFEKWTVRGLGIVHLICATLLLYLHFRIRTNLVYMKEWRNFLQEFRKKFLREAVLETSRSQMINSLLDKNPSQLSRADKLEIFKELRQLDDHNKSIKTVPNLLLIYYTVTFYYADKVLGYFVFYFLCSLLAITFDAHVFYSISLFEIVVIHTQITPRTALRPSGTW